MRFLLSAIFLAFIALQGTGQTIQDHDTSKRIHTYLSALENVGFKGSVWIAKNGVIIASEGYGYSDVDRQLKNIPSTIFDIGSITKQFTAAAILKLEMQGRLTTNDRISKFFENIPLDKQQITIHDLLRHQSGLISHIGTDYETIGEKEFLDKVLSSQLKFPTGTKFSYSNIGYSLLAMIIERATHQTYESFLYENLWKPSDMEMTGYSRPPFDTSHIATGYFSNDLPWGKPTDKEWDDTAPYWHLKGNGGILSTTHDLYKWHQHLMADHILSKKAKRKLYHPKLRTGENKKGFYGYGWDVSQTKRKTLQVWHNGTNHIFYADFLRYPDEKVVLILLSNKFHPNFENVNFEMAKMIFDTSYVPEIPVEDNERNRNFTNRIIKTIQESGLEKAKDVFEKRKESEQLLEFEMRNKGFEHIDNRRHEIAIQIFEMNVIAYPKSYKSLQGLAEGYYETGQKDMALLYFKVSQRINPDNPFVNDMIKKIEKR